MNNIIKSILIICLLLISVIQFKINAKVHCFHPTETIRLAILMDYYLYKNIDHENIDLLKEPKIKANDEIRIEGFIKESDYESFNRLVDHQQKLDLKKTVFENNRIPDYAFVSYANHITNSDPPLAWRDSYPQYIYRDYIYLPENIIEIGEGAFSNCTINDFRWPDSIEFIGPLAFYQATIERGFSLPKSLKRIGKSCFEASNGFKNLSVPEGIEEIPESAFNCIIDGYLDLPSSIKKVEKYSLYCVTYKQFSDLYCRATEPPICNPMFSHYSEYEYEKEQEEYTISNVTLYVPIGSKSAYRNALGWSHFENIVETDQFPER